MPPETAVFSDVTWPEVVVAFIFFLIVAIPFFFGKEKGIDI